MSNAYRTRRGPDGEWQVMGPDTMIGMARQADAKWLCAKLNDAYSSGRRDIRELKHLGDLERYGRYFAVVESLSEEGARRWTVLENSDPDEDADEFDDFVAEFANYADAAGFAKLKASTTTRKGGQAR